MSLVDRTDALIRSLKLSTTLMQQLAQGLRTRRTQWISAKPSVLAEAPTALASLTEDLQKEEDRRQKLLLELASLLPAMPGAAGPRHVNTTFLSQHLPRDVAARLRRATDDASGAASQVRRELALGERLLRFTQNAHEHLVAGVSQQLAKTRDDVGSYDRNARRLQAALPRTGSAPGNLVDGRI